jgi:hypothetical protein
MRIAASIGFLLFPVILALLGYAQFRDGWIRDQALPIPNYLLLGQRATKGAYISASEILAGSDRADGTIAIFQAEAALNGGAAPQSQIEIIKSGLRASPASARGWLLLAFASGKYDPALTQRAAAMGYVMGPMDYWLAKIRAHQASNLWPYLDDDTRQLALSQTRLFWEEAALRGSLPDLLSTPEGAQLVTRAFVGRSTELIALNRWALKVASARMSRP